MLTYAEVRAALGVIRRELELSDDDEGHYVCLALKAHLSPLFARTLAQSAYGLAGDALAKMGVFVEVQTFLHGEARANEREPGDDEIVAEDACLYADDYKEWQAAARAMRIKLVDHLIEVYS